MANCPAPLIPVRDYFRSKPRKKRTAKAGSYYWTCVDDHGRTCGKHHTRLSGASEHSRQLNRKARNERAYRGRGKLNHWTAERRQA